MLYLKECKKVIFSLTFLIYAVVVFLMYSSQFDYDNREPLERPVQGLADYGMVAKEVPEILMPAAIEGLVEEYLSGSFNAYPYGFIKYVRLKEDEKSDMAEIIYELSGITPEELNSFENYEPGGYIMDENGYIIYSEPNLPAINIPDDLTYEHFRELMDEADRIIGGGSRYSDSYIVGNFSLVPKTYEDALEEYNLFFTEDHIIGGYARLYCDYLGIVVAILPVFVAASLTGLDKKSHMEQLLYTRKISSMKLIITRFLALISVMMVPVLLTAFDAYIDIKALYPENDLNVMILLQYVFCWLGPNLTAAAAMGMLVTECTSGLVAIFVQGAWWFYSIFASTGGLTGAIGKFTFVMRHNNLLKYDIFIAQMDDIIFNRIFYTVLSIIIVLLTVFIHSQKRRGFFNGMGIFVKNIKRKSKA